MTSALGGLDALRTAVAPGGAFNAMASYPQWILWKPIPSTARPGKIDKKPVCPHSGKVASAFAPANWADADTAIKKALEFRQTDPTLGVGFALTKSDPFWFLDIDHCLEPDGKWSKLATDLISWLPGVAIEVSQSGRGLHLFGCGEVPLHCCKNDTLSLEFYTEGRFAALTGINAVGDSGSRVPEHIAAVAITYFPLSAAAASPAGEWADSPCEGWSGPTDDAELLKAALASTSATTVFGSKASFKDLWTGDADALGRAFPDPQRAYDASSADAALAQRLAFWTGRDSQRIERLMRQSALARPKWDRPDYLPRTILRACSQQGEVLGSRQTVPALPTVQAAPATGGTVGSWPAPEPIAPRLIPEPYPLDALPMTLRAAVTEVQGFVKAPVSMVACSALAALAIAAQAHVDVQRAVKLTGPTSLYTLTVADSGERKSTLDGFFTGPIRDWEAKEATRLAPALKTHEAALATWQAKRDGLRDAIKAASKAGKPTSDIEAKLSTLDATRPIAPRVPKVMRVDDTPEALAWLLATEWPSAAVVSSEGGLVLGAHGMSRETIMRNLAQLNIFWDGGTLPIGRRTSESFTVRGARLTVALQVQEPTLHSFFEGAKGLARGTGFLARFLICWPESTQGFRLFTEPPTAWPALAAFNRRIEELLNKPVPVAADGALTPAMLSLSPEAKAVWVAFHNEVEAHLAAGGMLADVRDVASKIADNGARIAALFHALEREVGGQIQADHMTAAARIAAWHLTEARRFFGEIALPEPMADAVRLERFLVAHCRRSGATRVARRDAQREGPVRTGKRLDAALNELTDTDRLRLLEIGKKKLMEINPALLG